ncbi:hypothetical protein [Sphingobium nicotianae]|uniref:Uncharacterized protein n=1 Tax=Sphingobium nicotianae TaxID=2782607 RepID=A0A9X1IT67_9SPHN|nr:hypothetical protein [Sphingobium nicotianae]MBT2189000.1 hypothetical protein [Sphingobium nicotianae]
MMREIVVTPHVDLSAGAEVEADFAAAHPVSLADRLARRFLDKPRQVRQHATSSMFPPRPTQLALPFGNGAPNPRDAAMPLTSLFREARRIEPVLSYERAPLDQLIPDTAPPPDAPCDALVLPGGIGLVLYDGAGGSLTFDWMQWGEAANPVPVGQKVDATVCAMELVKGARAVRKLARHRCVVPLTRYSVPVRDRDVWSHLWMSPAPGHFACVAGVWAAAPGERARFALVMDGGEPTAPLLLSERDLLIWLRSPIKDALARIARHASSPS